MSEAAIEAHLYDWEAWSRPEQTPPHESDWTCWLFLGGRGAGKTRAGAEWLRGQVKAGARRVALVGPTFSDVREVMISGPSGLLNIGPPSGRPKYEASRHRLIWPCGAEGHAFSAEDPDSLRGPQFEAAWCDDIDFIGIDWYAPLSDWREGHAHLDALDGAPSIYDPAYLASQVEGGEGFDWFYASAADRESQTRTPITDGAHGEPWVWRYKDLRSWWSEAHHDRIAGVRQTAPTAWVPHSKPVRLVELGCPAVDKGANQPNVFLDPKSSESTAPYFSTGARDDLIQRRYIEALLGHWQGATNPVSSVYAGPMLDLAHCHVWTWDARPFPEFPTRDGVWSDGANWRRGHWLTGRAGQSLVGEVVADIAARAGLPALDTTGVDGVLAGYVIAGGARARDEIERLGLVFGFDIVDRASGAVCVAQSLDTGPTVLTTDRLVHPDRGEDLSLSREPEETLPREVRVQFHADDGDYRPASAAALGIDFALEGVIDIPLRALSDRDIAAGWAQEALARARAEALSARLTLSPSHIALEAGDAITLDAGPDGQVWRIAAADGRADRQCDLIGASAPSPARAGPDPASAPAPRPSSRPALVLMDLPRRPGQPAREGFLAAAWADPWPGKLTVMAGPDVENAQTRSSLTAPAFVGQLVSTLASGFEGRWDNSSTVQLQLFSGTLSSAGAASVLNGTNRLAIETDAGWEVVGFTTATLGPDGSWTLTGLLRGLGGTPVTGASAGARVVVLDDASVTLPVDPHEVGTLLSVLAVPPGKAINDVSVRLVEAQYDGVEDRPLSPVHLKSVWAGGDLQLSWIRRARIDADAWGYGDIALDEPREAYQLTLLDDGEIVEQTEVPAPTHTLSAASLATLFPAGLAHARWKVAQISDSFGPGAAREAALSSLS